MSDRWISPCGTIDLRCGRWQDVLADVEKCDAVITDPPYSERTEKGVRSGSTMMDQRNQIGMGYAPIAENDCIEIVAEWGRRCRGWMFVCGDHITWQWHERAARDAGRYCFPPLPIVKNGAAPRMCADGPASQAEFCAVSRPATSAFVGTWPALRGWYVMETVRNGHETQTVRGAKSIDLMRVLVRDYSRPGDLVVDPFAGGATTLLACAIEGRRCIGAEMDPKTYALAVKRLSAGWTPVEQRLCVKPKQKVLF